MEAQQPPPPPEKSLEQELKDTVQSVKKEVPASLSEVEKLPFHLLLMLLGAGLSILLGVLFFFFSIFGRHPFYAIVNLVVCLIFGAALLFSFVIAKRSRLLGGIMAGFSGLVLMAGGGAGGFIGGLAGLAGAALALLKEFGILDK
jgi:hypothetical protein